MSLKYLYRYEANEFDKDKPYLEKYEIISPTSKGFWVSFSDSKKWVSSYSVKRFAYPTEHEAMESYIIRKMRYVENCRRNLERAERHYAAAKKNRVGHDNLVKKCNHCLVLKFTRGC